jgi:hypothetical protein
VYCGTSPTTMTIQNSPTLGPGQTWVQEDTLSTTGRLPRMIQRG